MRLLIVDDNLALIWRLRSYLGKYFEIIHTAQTGGEGQRKAIGKHYDAIILDLTLPDINGEDVCNTLREQGLMTPILVLTGRDTLSSKVQLLDSGADDYLTKPFEPEELLARTRALLRRNPSITTPTLLSVGDLIIDPERRTVMRSGISIVLRRKEFDILEYLARNTGLVVTPVMIIDHVWGNLDGDTWNTTIRVHIKNIRDKIDRPFTDPLIRTSRGVGYILG